MEPFRITCTTCKARLKVRSAELIGHILACPRCQSMVQVVAPPVANPAADSVQSSTASGVDNRLSDSSITESADASFDVIPEMLAGALSPGKSAADSEIKPAPSQPATVSPENRNAEQSNPAPQEKETRQPKAVQRKPARTTPAATTNSEESASRKKEKVAAAAVAAMAPEDMAAAAPVSDSSMASDGWTSPTEQLWQKVALWGAAGGAGLFLVGGLFGMWIANSGDTETDQPSAVASSNASGESSESTEERNDSTTEATESVAADDEESVNGDVGETENENPNSESPPASPSEKLPEEDPSSSLSESTEPQADEPEKNELSEENQLVDQGTDSPPTSPAPNPAGKTADAPPPDDKTAGIAEAPPAENPAEKPAAIRHDPRPAEEWIPTDVAKQLDHKLSRVSFESVAMIDVVNFVSQASRVPITVDTDALRIYGLSPGASVTLDKENVKLSEVLRAALRPFELSYLEGEGQVRVVNPKLRDKSFRQYKYPIDDLTEGSTADAAQLVAWIKRLVAPSSWDIANGPGTLDAVADTMLIEQTAPFRFEALAFCERLRRARGLPLKSRFPAERFSLVSGRTLAEKSLARPITFTFHSPTPLPQVTGFLEQTTGQTILIDWESLIRSGFTPATKVSCAIEDRPLDEALTRVLTPLGLGWRSLDAQTLQILSLADSRSARELVFYSVPQWIGRGYDEARFEQLVSAAASAVDPALASKVDIALDTPSHRLIVFANQESQRHIAEALTAKQDVRKSK